MVRRHPVYSFQKYNMHVKIFITSIQWFLWHSCLVDSRKTDSAEKCCIVYFFITHCIEEHSRYIDNGRIVVEKHAHLWSIGKSVCKKYKPNNKANCKSVYQLNFLKKAFVLCNCIWGNKLLLPSFINNGNDAVTKR